MALSQKENDLLTLTGPGTPCGDLMRRYWQPAALSEELPEGGAPLSIRLLGEELVLFRTPSPSPLPQGGEEKDEGGIGLLGIHCSHRGADLSYGRLEDGGLRCIYHGWLYNVHGHCLEQPGEPANGNAEFGLQSAELAAPRDPHSAIRNPHSAIKHKESAPAHSAIRNPHSAIKHLAYPCREIGGLILTYMGPGEPPLVPNYDPFTVPADHVVVSKIFSECNYLQGNEGNIDLLHTSFLHFIKRDLAGLSERERQAAAERYAEPESLAGRGPSPHMERCEAQPLRYGLRIAKIRETDTDSIYLRLATFVLPNFTVIPGGGINWHVPIDDTHHWKYTIAFNREQPVSREGGGRRDGLAPPPTYRPVTNRENRYLQDRESMRSTSYCGVPQIYFAGQDLCATETAGPIQDRSQEHLAPNDAPIVAARAILRQAILDVQEGREPANVVRDPAANAFPDIVAGYGMIQRSLGWKAYCEDLVGHGRGWSTARGAGGG